MPDPVALTPSHRSRSEATVRSPARLASITRIARSLGIASCVIGTLLGSACTGGLNRSSGLRGLPDGGLPDLRPSTSAPDPAAASAPTASHAGIDRRDWPLVVVPVPSDQVEFQPTYFEPLVLASGPARVRGEAPTTETVVDGASDGGSLLLEAAVAPFVWAGEMVIAPGRMIFQPPWTTVTGPKAQPQGVVNAPADWRWVEPAP